jgi:copper chaperone CopZ
MSNWLFCQVDGKNAADGDLPAKLLAHLQPHSGGQAAEIKYVSAVTVLSLNGLTCQNCVRKIQKCLQSLGPGLINCDIDLDQGLAFIDYDFQQLTSGRLAEAVASADPKFTAQLCRDVEAAVRGRMSDKTKDVKLRDSQG